MRNNTEDLSPSPVTQKILKKSVTVESEAQTPYLRVSSQLRR